MIYILGGRGYVGSAVARLCAARGLDHRVITRENYAELAGTSCRVFVNANGNSKKFLSTREPMTDFDASVRTVRQTLVDFDAEGDVKRLWKRSVGKGLGRKYLTVAPAIIADRIGHPMLARTDANADRVGTEFRGHIIRRHQDAPGLIARIMHRRFAQDLSTDGRFDAITTN